jgi:hypothetical protein
VNYDTVSKSYFYISSVNIIVITFLDVIVRCSLGVVSTENWIEGSSAFLDRLFKDQENFDLAQLLDLKDVFPAGVVVAETVKGRTTTNIVLWAVELYPLEEFWKR